MMMMWRWLVLEYLALWEGRLTADRLARLTGLTRSHAQKAVISSYRDRFPGRLSPIPKGVTIDPDGPATRWVLSDPGGFVAALTGLKAVTTDAWPLEAGFESVSQICRSHADNRAFIPLYRAMCMERCAFITYRSKTSLRSYAFSPHTLVETGSRPHFRGYAADPVTGEGKFLDLVPLRVAHLEAFGENYVSAETDLEWHKTTDMSFEIRDDVSDEVRDAIALEYELDRTGALMVPEVRHPLERYVERYFLAVHVEGREAPIFRRTT